MPSFALTNLTFGDSATRPRRICFSSLRLPFLRKGIASRDVCDVTPPHKIAEDGYLYKASLVAAACHDMRQPLQALELLSESLKESKLEPAQHKLALQMSRSVGVLCDMLDQMLAMLQLDAPAYRPDIGDVSIGQMIEQLENDFEPMAHAKGLEFVVECYSALIRSDRVWLYRALSNLVANAICYTHRGKVVIRCLERSGKLCIEVSDTGIGMAAEEIHRVFDDYYRIEGFQCKYHLGLGLANVRRIGKLLGLDVFVKSEIGAGSTFWLEIDLKAA